MPSKTKRAFDLCVALAALIALMPLMIWIAFKIKAEMGSPVLFTQIRPGYRGKPFKMYKFRTMRDVFDADGQPLADAERLTPFGAWLRRSSLDELPELINIVLGQMSLVGPRPLLMRYLPLYSAEQARRHEALPGLTGWAQINGRNAISWEERFRYDLWYVKHQSLGLDIWILWCTVFKVLRREGISAENHVTMPEFTGSAQNSDNRDVHRTTQ